jgi:hypothetical protein
MREGGPGQLLNPRAAARISRGKQPRSPVGDVPAARLYHNDKDTALL